MTSLAGRRLSSALACLFLTTASAQGDFLSQDESVVLLNLIAVKGAACDLLRPWEAATVQAMADQATLGWEDARREVVDGETEARLAQTDCSEPFLSAWIEGARPGMEAEYLSLHLVVYRTLLSLTTLPESLSHVATRTSPTADIATIDTKLAALEASGARPEGGGPWPAFIARTSAAVEEFVPLLDRGEAPAQVAFVIVRSIEIAELWLAGEDSD